MVTFVSHQFYSCPRCGDGQVVIHNPTGMSAVLECYGCGYAQGISAESVEYIKEAAERMRQPLPRGLAEGAIGG